MDFSYVKKDPSCFDSSNGSIDIIVSNTAGKVFLNWINLPRQAIIHNDGMSIKNVPYGIYRVELEDDIYFGQTKKHIDIELVRPQKLSVDFVQISYPRCHQNTGEVKVFISGGLSPYRVTMGHFSAITNDVAIFENIANYTSFNKITVTDKNGCHIEHNESILFHTKQLTIKTIYRNVIKPEEKSSLVKAYVQNGNPPYKIGWFDSNGRIIATNTDQLENCLSSGSYSIKAIDAEGCEAIEHFTIEAPKPISVNYTTKADYSCNNLFPYAKLLKLHNLILLPKGQYSGFEKIIPGDEIVILNKKKKRNRQSVVLYSGYITLNSTEYFYFYIANGLKISDRIALVKNDYSLEYKEEKAHLSLVLDKRSSPKLLIGSLILEKNLDYAFNAQDLLEINIDGKITTGKLYQKLNKYNFYSPLTVNTILLVLSTENTQMLRDLNSLNGFNTTYIRSLTTKKNPQKGSIYLKISGGIGGYLGVLNNEDSGYRYKIYCSSVENNYNQIFYTNHLLEISPLDCGRYIIKIEDIVGNTVDIVNEEPTHNNEFSVYITGSVEEEQSMIASKINAVNTAKTKNIFPKFKKIATPAYNRANLLINLKPINDTYELFGPDNFYQKILSGYEIIQNILPGKYTIKYKDKTKDLFLVQNDTHYLNSMD